MVIVIIGIAAVSGFVFYTHYFTSPSLTIDSVNASAGYDPSYFLGTTNFSYTLTITLTMNFKNPVTTDTFPGPCGFTIKTVSTS